MRNRPSFFDRVICGNCCDVLPSLPEGCARLIITSPPYCAGKEFDDEGVTNDYKQFAFDWTSFIQRLLTPDGSFWLNVGYTVIGPNETLPLSYLYYQIVRQCHGLRLVQELVWHYEGGMSYKRRFTHRTERWLWFAANPDKVVFNLDAVRDPTANRTKDRRNNPLGKNPTDYWYFNRVVSGTGRVAEKTAHPTQFPERMIERIVLACSNAGDLVVDPMMGSGTVCAVAKRLGRRYLGIDRHAPYCAIARQRIKGSRP
jgi:DNA modification methylase